MAEGRVWLRGLDMVSCGNTVIQQNSIVASKNMMLNYNIDPKCTQNAKKVLQKCCIIISCSSQKNNMHIGWV